jgi:predicted metal-dependent hydrolase
LLRRRVPKKAAEVYDEFARHPTVTETTLEKRRERGRKIVTSAKGAVYNLDEIFKRLNKKYFADAIRKPILTWSRGRTFRIFGHHDATHETVVISKTLDDTRVPEFVVEFVLYHELLHIKHPTRTINGRRRIHTAAFRRDEELFPQFEEAEKWLERLSRQNRRRKTSTTGF